MTKDIIYSITCMCFTIVLGGAVYEHIAVVPRWSQAPPASLSMFQGRYGLNAGLFWMIIHPVNLALFVATLILHWRTGRKKHVLIPFVTYVLILIITATFFVPELMSIINTPFSETPDAALTGRAKLWEGLSIARLIVLVVLVIILFLGLTKPVSRGEKLSIVPPRGRVFHLALLRN